MLFVDSLLVVDVIFHFDVAWLDELRVTEVRRKSDFAGRLQATARFSNFTDVTLSYQKTGADFFPLSAKQPSGATTINRSLRLGVKVDRLFLPS